MEILSDATFKGNVSIEGKTGIKELNLVYPDGRSYAYITGSEFSLIEDSIHGDICGLRVSKALAAETICASNITVKSLDLTDSTSQLSSGNSRFTLPRKYYTGTIALTYDCPKVLEKHLVAPADCTLFAVPSDGDFTNIFKNVCFATSVLSYRVDKVWHNGSCTLIDGCFWENTDIDVIMTNGNYNGCPFLIRKAAGLEMTEASYTNKTPGYKLVVTYL